MRGSRAMGGGLALLALAALLMVASAGPVTDKPWPVFTAEEVRQCGRIRTPEITVTPSRLLLFAQCRSANASVGSTADTSRAFDNMVHAKVVSKASIDNGRTWANFTVHTPVAHSHGAAIYDRVAKQVVFQFQYHPNSNPDNHSSYLQRVSHDDGLSWPGGTRDITAQLDGCNPHRPLGMMVESGGSKIQSSSGRLLFAGHTLLSNVSGAGNSCVCLSDDHGATYHSSNLFQDNELSMVELAPGRLLMNGRAGSNSWSPNRTQYFSVNDGTSWGEGHPTSLQDNHWPDNHNQKGCEAALIAVPNLTGTTAGSRPPVLFFSEPTGPKRTGLVLRCSRDGGVTPHPAPKPTSSHSNACPVTPQAHARACVTWPGRRCDLAGPPGGQRS